MRGERKSNGGNEGHRERQQELGTTFQTEAAVIFLAVALSISRQKTL